MVAGDVANAANAIKISLVGTLPGGESWTSSFWVQGTILHTAVELANTLTDVDTQFRAGGGFYAWFSSFNPSTATIDKLEAYQYDGSGPAAVHAEKIITQVIGTVAVKLPNQCALVATLRTGIPGRSFRGRMYIPCLSVVMAAGNAVATATAQALASDLATSFGAFNAIGDGKVVVNSPRLAATHPITQVTVDTVVDTQRRRRDKTPATVMQAAVAA